MFQVKAVCFLRKSEVLTEGDEITLRAQLFLSSFHPLLNINTNVKSCQNNVNGIRDRYMKTIRYKETNKGVENGLGREINAL